jgi:hypothetical protein
MSGSFAAAAACHQTLRLAFVATENTIPAHSGTKAMHWIAPPEKDTDNTALEKRLCRLNLAVHGREGDIRHGGQTNSYYDDPHEATDRFDCILAKLSLRQCIFTKFTFRISGVC